MFYRIKKNLTQKNMLVLSILKELLKNDRVLLKDIKSLKECEDFQKKTGKCDMETFKAFMKQKKAPNAERRALSVKNNVGGHHA